MSYQHDKEDESYRDFGVASEALSDEPLLSTMEENINSANTQYLSLLRNDIIGSYKFFNGPFGEKSLIYSDWTASGRSLNQVEEYIRLQVLPLYGNTHTTTSISGHQSTCYRNEARQIVAQAVNARVYSLYIHNTLKIILSTQITGKAAEDVVLFIGNGIMNNIMLFIR